LSCRREGDDVARGDILAQMTDIEKMEVRAFVPLAASSASSTCLNMLRNNVRVDLGRSLFDLL